MGNHELLTVEEMSARLKVPRSWLYRHTGVRGGDFPVIRVGKYCRFYPDVVMAWIEKQNRAQAVRGLRDD